jgi:HEAT repeat protein
MIRAVLEFYAPRVQSLRRRRDVPGLVATLGQGGARQRRAAANALIEIPDPRSVAALTVALGDADEAVRRNAALALGELQDARPNTELDAIVDPLVRALGDASPLVRVSAVSALGRMKSPRAVAPLEALASDGDDLVRKTVAAVLRGFASA